MKTFLQTVWATVRAGLWRWFDMTLAGVVALTLGLAYFEYPVPPLYLVAGFGAVAATFVLIAIELGAVLRNNIDDEDDELEAKQEAQ